MEKEGNIGYRYCIFCGTDTKHKINGMVTDGVTCLMCGISYIRDDISGVLVEYECEKNFEK